MKGRRGWGQLLISSLVDAISIGNQMAKQRSAVSVFYRLQNVGSVFNAGCSSSLHTRMNVTARLMQPLRCAATHLETGYRLLQHASNTQRTQALARQAQRTAHSTRAAAAAPALSSRDPASHAPSPSQPSSTTCRPCAYRQAQWPVAGTRTPHRGA